MVCDPEFAALCFFVLPLAPLEDGRRIALFEENETQDGVDCADDGEEPEHPAPRKMLNEQAAEEWTECRA